MNSNTQTTAINASNIHYGGALQVAVSFIQEISSKKLQASHMSLYISNEIHRELVTLEVNLHPFKNVTKINTTKSPLSLLKIWVKLKKYKIVFTLFGPFYGPRLPGMHIQGYAQAWILRGTNDVSNTFSFWQRNKHKVKYSIQKWFFAQADKLIVESEKSATLMEEDPLLKTTKTIVVNNAISAVYLNAEPKPTLDNDIKKNTINIGSLSRDYPHKNLDYLVSVKKILENSTHANVNIFVTLTQNEWQNRSEEFRSMVFNKGSIGISDGPSFYRDLDIVLFSSLLETFSATPIESLAMAVPLFASDRDFVRDFCLDHALYVDPNHPEDAAKKIEYYVKNSLGTDEEATRLNNARDYVLENYSPTQRMESYVACINNAADEEKLEQID